MATGPMTSGPARPTSGRAVAGSPARPTSGRTASSSGGSSGGGTGTAPIPYGGLEGDSLDAAVTLTNLFKSYGLGTLAPKIIDFLKKGYSSDRISIELQETKEYKQRFSANDARRAAGLPVLSPAEYLSTESSYRQVMSAAGLPVGFYDKPSDFTNWIAGDVSPTEVQQRVQVASDLVNNSDPATLAYFKSHYTTGDMVAYALDRKRATPLIENQLKAAQIGGAGSAQGINVRQSQAELLARQGISQSQAQQGFGQVADNLKPTQLLGDIYGSQVTQDDLVAEVFQNNATATQKRKTLSSKERAAFGGSGGIGKSSLSQGKAGSV